MFDRHSGKYYQLEAHRLPSDILAASCERSSRIKKHHAYWFAGLLCTLLGFNVLFGFLALSPVFDAAFIVLLATYLIFSIAIHEFAHALALRLMGRRTDRVGVKLHYWIFPAFFVRMNQSLLLSRYGKVIVHGAGLFVNLFINGVLILLNFAVIRSAPLMGSLQFVALTLAFNATPLLKSDGYRIVLALANTDAAKGFRHNVWWLNGVHVASITYAVIYTIYLGGSIVSNL